LEKTKKHLESKRQNDESHQDPSDPESTISSLTTSTDSAKLLSYDVSTSKKKSNDKNSSSACDTRKAKKSKRNHKSQDLEGECDEDSITLRPSRGSEYEGTDKAEAFRDATSCRSMKNCPNSAGSRDVLLDSVDADPKGSLHGVASKELHSSAPCKTSCEMNVDGLLKESMLTESTSMDTSFQLDYEEVFIRSSVPQLLATTAGKIVAWNDMFLKAAGLLSGDVDNLTIFSLVQQSELVKLFEIVAAALRSDTMLNDELEREKMTRAVAGYPDVSTQDVVSLVTNYTAITLPCASFRPRYTIDKLRPIESMSTLLYMTITLMADIDPKKRCFHCVFTDSPGTNGALGSVTPELLSLLFCNQNKVNANAAGTSTAAKNA
jgi:hypothetical protein